MSFSCSVVSSFLQPMDCSPPGSSVQGISQARILEWVAVSFCSGSSQPRDRTHISCIAGGFFTAEPPGSPTNCYSLIWRKTTWRELYCHFEDFLKRSLHSLRFSYIWESFLIQQNLQGEISFCDLPLQYPGARNIDYCLILLKTVRSSILNKDL